MCETWKITYLIILSYRLVLVQFDPQLNKAEEIKAQGKVPVPCLPHHRLIVFISFHSAFIRLTSYPDSAETKALQRLQVG